MAEIWKARSTGAAGFEKIFAIKRVLPQYAEDEEFVDMFVGEARLVAMLAHPNIDVNARDSRGDTVIDRFSREHDTDQEKRNYSEIVRLLRAAGARECPYTQLHPDYQQVCGNTGTQE